MQQHNTDSERVVVIGNGMVGFRFCDLITGDERARDRMNVTVFGEESIPAYDRVHLTSYLEGTSLESLQLAPRDWYDRRGIDLHAGDPVVCIDRRAHAVHSLSGREIGYDRLILATGSRPVVPPIPGRDTDGVFVYRTVHDLDAIRQRALAGTSAAVIGGGLLGLEVAEALHAVMGLRTYVIERAKQLLPGRIGTASAELVRERIERQGVVTLIDRGVSRIIADGDRLVLSVSGRRPITVDVVVIAAGVRPRDELARACGMDVSNPRGGIIVDDHMVSSDPDVVAIGECASHRDMVYGFVGPGYEMARVAAHNISGDDEHFARRAASWRTRLFGMDVAALGDCRVDDRSRCHSYVGDSRRCVVVRDGRIVGASVIGDWGEIARADDAIAKREKIAHGALSRFARTGRLWHARSPSVIEWSATAQVCSCVGVTRGDLCRAQERGCRTVAALSSATGAGSVCGSCKPLLAQLCGVAGDEITGATRRPLQWLLWLSAAGFAFALAFFALPPIPLGPSAEGPLYELSALWRDSTLKHITGFSLVGVASLTLLLSARKRLRWFRIGAYAWHRVVHASIGVAALGLVVAHTGMHLGHNLNRALMLTFLSVVLTGGLLGAATAGTASTGDIAQVARRARPTLVWSHWLCLWALPVLVAFHVVGVYYF